ncbi:unnamed protein product (macronuclear) [Paramecium tetraurelia]|uniref:Serine aminopeptidase S33 domain-containing protein n=1 Tax=Paramecium tetraurelia TaxID=5888 RepID=A0DSW5_PARTE|nr:uncharacterized protein GSPATT00019825001 [Paramecium tetraurelia]CAK86132.1 unnamed protein product [Paramecium tetraurelia]|eukprot:XP_001453529.1 hypothetical protein (macronuclear) [Paramecium tetraurelia strain d4-2]
MDLDFIFFPAPKEISTEHEQGQILWIPKYKKLYPIFKNYVPRTNKKRGVYFKQRELESEDDEHSIIEEPRQSSFNQSSECQLQPIPNFPCKPATQRQQIRQTSEINSPSFDSNEGSPDVSYKLQQLNMQSIQIPSKKFELCRKISNFYPKTKAKKSFCFSQPLIKLPKQLLDKKIENFVLEEPTVHRSNSRESNHIFGHIPCMYVDSKIHSPNIVLYFHANCEDITQAYQFLIHLRDNLNVSAIAMEYPGYGKYKNEQPNAEFILKDAEYVYNYLTKRLGYNENRIIIFGRSIGSGPATYIASKYKPACLALMSPFTSLKAAVRDYVGSWAQYLIRQRFDNLDQIKKVKIPTFILHGKADNIIPYTQAQELYKNCISRECIMHLADDMDHISYKLYKDLINPFTEFLIQIKYYQNCSQAPKLPTVLFYNPTIE